MQASQGTFVEICFFFIFIYETFVLIVDIDQMFMFVGGIDGASVNDEVSEQFSVIGSKFAKSECSGSLIEIV